jgi:hypothetical protein
LIAALLERGRVIASRPTRKREAMAEPVALHESGFPPDESSFRTPVKRDAAQNNP